MVVRRGVCGSVLLILVAAGVLVLTAGCVSYETRGVTTERGLPIELKDLVIVHYGPRIVQIGDPEVAGGVLTGYVIDPPLTYRHSRQREMHVYVSQSHPLELQADSSVSIPVETIRRVEVYNVDVKRTVRDTSLLSSVLTAGGLYLVGLAVSFVFAFFFMMG